LATYVPTDRNGVIGGLFERLGFTRLATAEAAAGASRWRLELEHYAPRPTFIARRSIG
jgi:hypothetical protein